MSGSRARGELDRTREGRCGVHFQACDSGWPDFAGRSRRGAAAYVHGLGTGFRRAVDVDGDRPFRDEWSVSKSLSWNSNRSDRRIRPAFGLDRASGDHGFRCQTASHTAFASRRAHFTPNFLQMLPLDGAAWIAPAQGAALQATLRHRVRNRRRRNRAELTARVQ